MLRRLSPIILFALLGIFVAAGCGQEFEISNDSEQDVGLNDTGPDCSDRCGEFECPLCEDGESCTVNTDCASQICSEGVCVATGCDEVTCGEGETCYRGECYDECEDGDDCEPDSRCYDENHCAPVDCEGIDCHSDETCYEGACYDECSGESDCQSTDTCTDNACIDPCEATECDAGQDCIQGECYEECDEHEDCEDGRCYEDVCVPLDCDGVDCPHQTECYYGVCKDSCSSDTDCHGNESCYDSVCVDPSCDDGAPSGDQSDVDCGGDCGPCEEGQQCNDGDDCENGICVAGFCGQSFVPDVRTDDPTDVTDDSAVLHGDLRDLGRPEATDHGLCLGTSADPTTDSADCEHLGAPADEGPFSATFDGLDQGQLYHVRAFAENDEGIEYGSNVELSLAPATPTNLTASTDEPSYVYLSWDASPGATEYEIERDGNVVETALDNEHNDADGPAPTVTPGEATATEGDYSTHVYLELSGASVEPGDSATYRVRAINDTATSDFSNEATGHRAADDVFYSWERSEGDSPEDFDNIGGNTESYEDTDAPEDGSVRYYRAMVGAMGADSVPTEAVPGYRSTAPEPHLYTTGLFPNHEVHKIDNERGEIWIFEEHDSSIRAVAVDPDGYVYTAGADNELDTTVRKIDPQGEQVWSVDDPDHQVMGIAVDADGYVYTASIDNVVRKFDPDGNQQMDFKFTGHSDGVEAVAVDADGYVYTASRDETVRKLDSDGDQQWEFDGHESSDFDTWVRSVAVDDDGNVYTASSDHTVRKLDSSGDEQWSFDHHTGTVWSVAVDADGYVYSASADGTVRKINSEGDPEWIFDKHEGDVYSVTVDTDGNVYSASADETARKIDADGDEVWVYDGHADIVYGIAINPGLYGAFPDEW